MTSHHQSDSRAALPCVGNNDDLPPIESAAAKGIKPLHRMLAPRSSDLPSTVYYCPAFAGAERHLTRRSAQQSGVPSWTKDNEPDRYRSRSSPRNLSFSHLYAQPSAMSGPSAPHCRTRSYLQRGRTDSTSLRPEDFPPAWGHSESQHVTSWLCLPHSVSDCRRLSDHRSPTEHPTLVARRKSHTGHSASDSSAVAIDGRPSESSWTLPAITTLPQTLQSLPLDEHHATSSHEHLSTPRQHDSAGTDNDNQQKQVRAMLWDFMRSRAAVAAIPSSDRRRLDFRKSQVADRFFVTLTCRHSAIAQKSYRLERRLLCPPPIVQIRGPGYTSASGSNVESARHLCLSILPDIGDAEMPTDPLEARSHQIVSEEVPLDCSVSAKFGHLHIGSNTNSAKTIRLYLEMIRSTSSRADGANEHKRPSKVARHGASQERSNHPRNHRSSISPPTASESGIDRSCLDSGTSAVMRRECWLACQGGPIAVISKPSNKRSRKQTSSNSQITPQLAICLLNRANSQNVRTKYMAVHDGRLSAQDESWATFHMRPVHFAGRRAGGYGYRIGNQAITYGSIIVLEASGGGIVSDPMIVCKVNNGRILVPSAFSKDSHRGEAGNDTDEGPISQMQKVAFMRYNPELLNNDIFDCFWPHADVRPAHTRGEARRAFLACATPDLCRRPPGEGPITPLSTSYKRTSRRLSGSVLDVSGSESIPVCLSPDAQSRSATGPLAGITMPFVEIGSGDSVNFHRGFATRRDVGTVNAEVIAPTPVIFLTASPDGANRRGEVGQSGSLLQGQDIADDALCWSVVGAASFEFSFAKTRAIEQDSSTTGKVTATLDDMPIDSLPQLSSPPIYLPELHAIQLKGDNLFGMVTLQQGRQGFGFLYDVWLGSIGPLHADLTSRQFGNRISTLHTRQVHFPLPPVGRLLQYVGALEREPPQFYPIPDRPNFPSSLPIILVKSSDGTICRTAYVVELIKVSDPVARHASSWSRPPRSASTLHEWTLRIVQSQ